MQARIAAGEDIDRVLQMASVSRKVFSTFYDLQLTKVLDKEQSMLEPSPGSAVTALTLSPGVAMLAPHSSMSPVSTGEQLALEDRV